MLIKRIKARNFKTYLNLDLDISVTPDKPIILIGGANGGGKTTLFEAIYGALYGLKLPNAKVFRQLLNAGALGIEEEKIMLELHFSGRVLDSEQQYVLTRTYILNPAGLPVESVKLNMNGTIFSYGSATPAAQRLEQEAQVNKIIKANLPQELSRYFLFDAMEAGNLLKEDQLNQVIRENIENVMGFNKYLELAKASESLCQSHTAEKLKLENEKAAYLALVEQRNLQQEELRKMDAKLRTALQYSVNNKELYDSLKTGLNQETTLKNKIEQTKLQIESIYKKEKLFREELDGFVKELELNIGVPKLIEAVRSEVHLMLQKKAEQAQRQNAHILPEQVEAVSQLVIDYLVQQHSLSAPADLNAIVDYVISRTAGDSNDDPYDFLDYSEVKALEAFLDTRTHNSFPVLNQQQIELNILQKQVPVLEVQIENMRAQISGRDYELIKQYEDNETSIKSLEGQIAEIKAAINKIEKQLHQFDVQTSQEPDPKFETLQKLKPFFEDLANQLLKVKKQQIELRMKQDLNVNLAAYRDVIERVSLSEDLKDLTFKIYHKAGNEIYLNQLNTASKQVVIQVLLKALHEYGDYDPPVMIDTVMGVLDEKSRATVLENYFPELSHQTILLSSDSEIRVDSDFMKIEPFIAKAITLERDRERQVTHVAEGYFGVTLNELV